MRRSQTLPAHGSLFGDKVDASSQNVQVILRVRPLTLMYYSGANGAGHQLASETLTEAQQLAQSRCIKDIIDNKVIVLHKSEEQFTFDFIAGEDIT